MFKIKLGVIVRDSITGFEGTTIARCEYLNGCIQYQLEGDEPTKPGGDIWVDEQRLHDINIIEPPATPIESIARTSRGGGMRSTPRLSHSR